jgi:hypothetical protein
VVYLTEFLIEARHELQAYSCRHGHTYQLMVMALARTWYVEERLDMYLRYDWHAGSDFTHLHTDGDMYGSIAKELL